VRSNPTASDAGNGAGYAFRVTLDSAAEKMSRLQLVGARLRIDAGTVDVVDSFEQAGVPALLLKGASIASWLYPDRTERPYVDCDLLVAPAQFATAEDVLSAMGYESLLGEMGMPSWWCEHAAWWQRPSDGLCVDLHRTLVGVRVDHATTWQVLSRDATDVLVAGRPVPTLDLPARTLHVALHAAQHGLGWGLAIADLERALAEADDDLWLAAADLAAELDATAAFLAGLRLVPAGRQLVARLRLPDVRSVEAELRAGSPPPLALAFEQLVRARGARARAAMVWRKLVPGVAFMRATDSCAIEDRFGLARAYLRRWSWMIQHAPRGLMAWYRARRSIRRAMR
jgi:putative nucleotidyltransferase-like protein